MKIDKSDKTELPTYEINPASAVNGTIYYNGTQDNHYLYAMNTATDRSLHRMGRQSVVPYRTGRLCLLYGCGK